jgi:hypothetical protein
MILNLISSPRNVSTALMYSFAHRGDLKVVDEPFYSYYLHLTDADHPGKNEIMQSLPSDYIQVIQEMTDLSEQHEHIFIKNMAHHLIEMDLGFLKKWKNILLIRNPKQLIASFAQVMPNPTQIDIGIKRQFEIYEFLKSENQRTFIIDSGELLKSPESVLTKLCQSLGLEMRKSMLQWKPGRISEDGVWAKYWYDNVHQSTGFAQQGTSSRPLPTHCQKLYEESLPYYQELSKLAIKAN